MPEKKGKSISRKNNKHNKNKKKKRKRKNNQGNKGRHDCLNPSDTSVLSHTAIRGMSWRIKNNWWNRRNRWNKGATLIPFDTDDDTGDTLILD